MSESGRTSGPPTASEGQQAPPEAGTRPAPDAVARAAAYIEQHLESGSAADGILRRAADPWDGETLAAALRACRASLLQADGATVADGRRAHEHHERLDALWAALADRKMRYQRERHLRFLREAAHDIRSPLHSILFLADALIEHRSGRLNELQARQLGVLYGATLSLVGLVNDLLDSSTAVVDSGPVAREPFSPADVLANVRRMVDPLCLSREIEVSCEVDGPGRRLGDDSVLTRLLGNLLSNAVQASEAGDRVGVWIGGGRDTLELRIRNRAQAPDVQAISDGLEGGSPGRRRTDAGGWQRGLGLEICARLIERAGGRASVEAEGGTVEVTVHLPFAAGEPLA